MCPNPLSIRLWRNPRLSFWPSNSLSSLHPPLNQPGDTFHRRGECCRSTRKSPPEPTAESQQQQRLPLYYLRWPASKMKGMELQVTWQQPWSWRLSVLEAGIAPDDHQVLTDVEDMGDHKNKNTFTCFFLRYHPPKALTWGLVQNSRPRGGL